MQQITARNVSSRLCHTVYGMHYSKLWCSIFFGAPEVCRVSCATCRVPSVEGPLRDPKGSRWPSQALSETSHISHFVLLQVLASCAITKSDLNVSVKILVYITLFVQPDSMETHMVAHSIFKIYIYFHNIF